MSTAEQAHLYQTYKDADSDPSPDQRRPEAGDQDRRSCLLQPHAQRLLRKQTFTGYQLSVATGKWSKREQPGSIISCLASLLAGLYRATMLLLEACDAERWTSMPRQSATTSPSLISRADAQMRSEQMERLRRQLRANPEHGHTEANPWPAVFMAATRDHEFWGRELSTPAGYVVPGRRKRELPG